MSMLRCNKKSGRKCSSWNLLGLVALAVVLSPSMSSACDYYASPNGNGNGLSQSSPFKISSFWSKALPGKTLCLLDGTYTGSDSMIDPGWNYGNVSGSSGNPITVRALNDGKVWINGQLSRRPVYLSNNDWLVLEGFNAFNGAGKVLVIGSNNVVVRRVITWNVTNGTAQGETGEETFLVAGSNNTVEDCASFGTGRKVLSAVQSGNDTVFRRCWARFQEHPQAQTQNHPDTAVEIGYNAVRQTFENIIATWDESGGGSFDEPEGIFRMWGNNEGALTLNSKILGSIGYVRPQYDSSTSNIFQLDKAKNVTLKDVVGFAQGTNKKPFFIENTVSSLTVQNVYAISNSTSNYNGIQNGTTLSGAIGSGNNVFQKVPGLCYRYQNGSLTSEPLWPWPMDQRIKEAIAFSGYKSVTWGMSNDSGYVTDAMEQLFGQSIPSQCRSNGGGTTTDNDPPSPPQNLRIAG